jgi:acetoin utilization protein AcuB
MEIRRWMKHPVRVVKPLVSIHHARELMVAGRVNQLPVVVDGRLVGIVTDRDLRDAFPSVFDTAPLEQQKPKAASDPRAITVENVMTANVITVGAGDSVIDAARRMREERIGALPVLENGRLVGIITRTDLLECLVDLAEREEKTVAGEPPSGDAAPEKPKGSRTKADTRTKQSRPRRSA